VCHGMLQDIHSHSDWWKSPTFAARAYPGSRLGIGVNSASFRVVNAVMLATFARFQRGPALVIYTSRTGWWVTACLRSDFLQIQKPKTRRLKRRGL